MVFLFCVSLNLISSQMIPPRFLFDRLPKPSEKLFPSVQKTRNIFLPSLFGLSTSNNEINVQIFNQKSAPHLPYSNGSLSFHTNPFLRNFTFCRLIHYDVEITQVEIDSDEKNPDLQRARIVQDADKLCKILSNDHKSSNIESALNSASVEVCPTLVAEVLKKLSNSGVLALLFFRWAEKRNGFKHTTESYNALVESLGKIKQFNVIWGLVNDMKRKGLLTKETFALISRRYARARKTGEAIEAFEKMGKFGLNAELSDYNRLIDTLSKSRHVEIAQQVFDKWKNRKLKPNIKSYTILLEGWGAKQNLLRLNELYREMKEDGFEADVVTYGIIINAYCKATKYDESVELFREMEGKNIKPSPHIYCTLINGLGSEKRLNEALKFFELSKASGYSPEAPTYNAVVGSYCWSMRMYDAYRVVEEMRKCGVGPNSRTYDIILHHLIKARRTKEAYSVFQRMSEEPGCEPTISTYEIIARMFCKEDRTDMALRVWDQMKAKGVFPGMHMFSTLITSLCRESTLDIACKYFQEMLDMGIRPPGPMFSTLKQALLDEGKEDIALSLNQKLQKQRRIPLVV